MNPEPAIRPHPDAPERLTTSCAVCGDLIGRNAAGRWADGSGIAPPVCSDDGIERYGHRPTTPTPADRVEALELVAAAARAFVDGHLEALPLEALPLGAGLLAGALADLDALEAP